MYKKVGELTIDEAIYLGNSVNLVRVKPVLDSKTRTFSYVITINENFLDGYVWIDDMEI